MATRVHIVLPDALIEEVDRVAGPRKRSELITEAIERYLLHERQRLAFEETAGILSDEDYPEWSSPEKISAWVRRGRDQDNQRLEEKIERWNVEE